MSVHNKQRASILQSVESFPMNMTRSRVERDLQSWRERLLKLVSKACSSVSLEKDLLTRELDQLEALTKHHLAIFKEALDVTAAQLQKIQLQKRLHHLFRPFALTLRSVGWSYSDARRIEAHFSGEEGFMTWLMKVLPPSGPILGRYDAGESLIFLNARDGLKYGQEVIVAGPAIGTAYRGKGLAVRHASEGKEFQLDVLAQEVCRLIPSFEIHRQVRHGNLAALRILMQFPRSRWEGGCVALDCCDENGVTALALATRGSPDIVAFLLQEGAAGRRTLRTSDDGFILAPRMIDARIVGDLGDKEKFGILLPPNATVKDLKTSVQRILQEEQPDNLEDIKILYGVNVLHETWKPLAEVGLSYLVTDINVVRSGRSLLALGSFDATVSVWDYLHGNVLYKIDNHDANSAVIYPGCKRMIMTVAEDKAEALDLGDGAPTVAHHFDLKAGAITTLVLDKEGTVLGAACEDGAVTIFDATTFKKIERLESGDRRGFGMTVAAISPCGRWIAASGRDETVWLWDRQLKEKVARKIEVKLPKVTCISFNADASMVAVALRDSTVRVCSVETGKELYSCSGHRGVVHGVFFSIRGLMVTGSRDGTAKLWERDVCVHTFLGHSASVNCVAISPDGAYLATGSEDSTCKIWDLDDRSCVHTLKSHIAGLSILTFASS